MAPGFMVAMGVHVLSWDSAVADAFWTENCGKGPWIGTLEEIEQALCCANDEAFWRLRMQSRRALVEAVRRASSVSRRRHVIPRHAEALVPLEAPEILWLR